MSVIHDQDWRLVFRVAATGLVGAAPVLFAGLAASKGRLDDAQLVMLCLASIFADVAMTLSFYWSGHSPIEAAAAVPVLELDQKKIFFGYSEDTHGGRGIPLGNARTCPSLR
jgi:hypothetical protein